MTPKVKTKSNTKVQENNISAQTKAEDKESSLNSKNHTEEKSSENKHKIKIALVGNPNVGKSVIFNYLTGLYVDVSNYPGTTIEITKSELKETNLPDFHFEIVDTPGVYGISSENDEEKATREFVLEASVIVNVVSATTLERDLFLSKQLADMGRPMFLVLNQSDEAKARKVHIDKKKLSSLLGMDVIETVAIENTGLDKIREALLEPFAESKKLDDLHRKNEDGSVTVKKSIEPKVAKLSPAIENKLAPYLEEYFDRAEALLALEEKTREEIYQIRRDEVSEIIDKTIELPEFSKRAIFSRLLMNPIFGSIFGLAILYLFLYQFLGIFIAGNVVGFTEETIMQGYYEPAVRFAIGKVVAIDGIIGTFLAGEYGVLTLTVTYLYGLLLPLVLGFYFGLAILEDSGYLPRLAVLVDGVLSKLGMNGRAIVPLILGGGCVTMATVTTRLLTSKKEKVITMALLGLTIPCSAQLGVIQGLLSTLGGPLPWLIWGGSLVLIFSLTGLILNKLMPGSCGHFLSDIPPLRLPRAKNIFSKAWTRTKVFMEEATVPFFVAAALVAFLQITGLLEKIILWTEPVISNLLLLPKETALSFILGMVRRDFGAFGLLEIQMEPFQLITACLVLTLFVPCIATVAVMVKEGNLKTAMLIWLSSWGLALGFGGIMARLLSITL